MQLSRTLVFQDVSRLYTPVKPTIFEINVGAFVGFHKLYSPVKPMIFEMNIGAVVQNVSFPGCFKVIYTG